MTRYEYFIIAREAEDAIWALPIYFIKHFLICIEH